MAPSSRCKAPLRRHRVRLYTWSDAGSGGVVDETYTFREEVWAGFAPGTVSERTQGEAETHDRMGTFTFHERVTINPTDMLQINGTNYRVQGIPDPVDFPEGMMRTVRAIWVDKANLSVSG